MTPAPVHWPAEDLWLAVNAQLPGFTVEVLPQIDSTNSELMRRARAGRTEPTLLVAEQQTAGRGRLGRTWVNAPGDSLMYSLGLAMAPHDWSGLSLVVGLSIAESLQPQPAAGAPRLGVKWPNDLWLHHGNGGDHLGSHRKLGGTLIETTSLPAHLHVPTVGSGAQAPRFVIIGTGINIRAPHPDAGGALHTPPGALHDIDADWSAASALRALFPALVTDLLRFAHEGLAPFVHRFAQRDLLRGLQVHLSDGTAGTAEGIAADGALLVRTASGVHPVLSADVSVRPAHMPLPTP